MVLLRPRVYADLEGLCLLPMTGLRHTPSLVPDADALARAVEVLSSGGLVAFPTETVYGLGADAANPHAVAQIFAVKGRPQFNPLIAHVADVAMARTLCRFDEMAQRLADAFWPGPLTLVLPVDETCAVCDLARAGLSSLAVRVPAHPVAQALITGFGGPVVAPSANRSGHVSPTTAQHVRDDLAEQAGCVLDAGPCRIGIESTIIACHDSGPVLLRAGGVPRDEIEAVLDRPLLTPVGGGVQAPGMLASHYAPRTPLRLEAVEVQPDEAVLGFGPTLPQGSGPARCVFNLSPAGDVVEAAAHLYAFLRDLDKVGATAIAVAPLPRHGLGEALHDRLTRAAQ